MSALTRVALVCGAAGSAFILPQMFCRDHGIAAQTKELRGLPVEEANAKPRGSGFVGHWRMVPGYSEEMEAIMVELGTPKYVHRLNKLGFETHMKVELKADDVLVENITKFNGLYNREVKLFMDGCQRVEYHPIDGSTIRAASYWCPVKRVSEDCEYRVVDGSDDSACNARDLKLAAVSDIYYDKYAKRHRVLRVIEDEGNTLHVVHSPRGEEGIPTNVLSAHRYLRKVDPQLAQGD